MKDVVLVMMVLSVEVQMRVSATRPCGFDECGRGEDVADAPEGMQGARADAVAFVDEFVRDERAGHPPEQERLQARAQRPGRFAFECGDAPVDDGKTAVG